MLAPAPAPDWTRTECLPTTSFLTVSGVAATRVSPARVSAGMPIFMDLFSGALSFFCRAAAPAEAKSDDTRPRIRGATDFEGARMTVKGGGVITGPDASGRAVVQID